MRRTAKLPTAPAVLLIVLSSAPGAATWRLRPRRVTPLSRGPSSARPFSGRCRTRSFCPQAMHPASAVSGAVSAARLAGRRDATGSS